MKRMLQASIGSVANWVERKGFRAYDPGDGDLSFLRHLTFNAHFLRRVLTAVVLRTPFHIRPWIGIRPHKSTKGMGYMAWGYLKLYSLTGAAEDRRRAESCFDWLMENTSRGWEDCCWGNHFSFSTRSGTIPRHMPTIVWSSLIGLAFLEGYECLGIEKYLDVANSVSRWIKDLPRERTGKGTCLSYVPFEQSSIHNSNMLGAALLAWSASYTDDPEGVELARESMEYSCSRQEGDGSWFYGEAPKYRWIDNFHTGYNLDCLKRYQESTGDTTFQRNMDRGFQYFKSRFFEDDGRPKYYADRTYPIDIQCAAQAIDTLAYFRDDDPDAVEMAIRTASWTIRNMQDPDGHFYYRDLGWMKVRTPMLHWGQATMFKALTHLMCAMSHESLERPGENSRPVDRAPNLTGGDEV